MPVGVEASRFCRVRQISVGAAFQDGVDPAPGAPQENVPQLKRQRPVYRQLANCPRGKNLHAIEVTRNISRSNNDPVQTGWAEGTGTDSGIRVSSIPTTPAVPTDLLPGSE